LLRAVTGSTDAEGMREIVRQKVEKSLQTSIGFKLRVFSLNDALCVYFESGTLIANTAKLRTLQADIASLVGDTERLQHLSNQDRSVSERKELDERIVEACTMKVSEQEGGLLLWLGEDDIQWLADDFGLSIRCWKTEWVDNKGDDSFVVDQVKLVWSFSPTKLSFRDSTETLACVDIAFTECHYDQIEFVQARFHGMRLDPSALKTPLGIKDHARLLGMRVELAKLEGKDPASLKSFATGTETEAAGESGAEIADAPMAAGSSQDRGGLNWKPRGKVSRARV
jgi:hypothetical protein